MSKHTPKDRLKKNVLPEAEEEDAAFAPTPEGARAVRAVAFACAFGILFWGTVGFALYAYLQGR